MHKQDLFFRADFLLSYAIEGRIQPVLAILDSIKNLGNIFHELVRTKIF